MIRRRSAFGVVMALSAMLCLAPGDGLADGDPASDYLLYQSAFTPLHPPSRALKERLIALADAAKKQGFPIRVAVIQAPIDLGAVPQLLGRPAVYARFLGAELRFAYRGRLLVVMERGYGYTKGGRSVPRSAKLLRSLAKPSGGSPDQLTAAAITALRRIAAASGHPLPAQPRIPRPRRRGTAESRSFLSRNVWTLVVGALIGASSIAWITILVVRVRRTRHDGGRAGS